LKHSFDEAFRIGSHAKRRRKKASSMQDPLSLVTFGSSITI
jgi:hypothetical protein